MLMAAAMPTSPTAAHTAWRKRKWYGLPWDSWASADEALHTVTSPRPMRATVTAKSVASEASFLATLGLPLQERSHLALEGPPAVGVVLEHVERSAGRGQQHHVARRRRGEGPLHGLAQRQAAHDRNHAGQGLGHPALGLADGHDRPAPPGQGLAQQAEVAALVA